ncbi:hypothetical protein FXW78_14195 [Rhodococcus opacus]|nr:hypothetical protein [Rhodococcus opacus]
MPVRAGRFHIRRLGDHHGLVAHTHEHPVIRGVGVIEGAAADHCRPSGVEQDEQSGDVALRLTIAGVSNGIAVAKDVRTPIRDGRGRHRPPTDAATTPMPNPAIKLRGGHLPGTRDPRSPT